MKLYTREAEDNIEALLQTQLFSLFYSEWGANQFDRKATTLERLFSLLSAISQLAAATNQFITRKELLRDYFFLFSAFLVNECSIYLISL